MASWKTVTAIRERSIFIGEKAMIIWLAFWRGSQLFLVFFWQKIARVNSVTVHCKAALLRTPLILKFHTYVVDSK